jgi:hypothetical protein
MYAHPMRSAAAEPGQTVPRFSTIRARVLTLVLLTMLPAFVLIIFKTVDERERAVTFTRQAALPTVRLIGTEQSQLIANTHQLS